MRKKSLVGYVDYDKEEKDFVYPIYVFTKRPTRHTNSYIVDKKVHVTIEEIRKD